MYLSVWSCTKSIIDYLILSFALALSGASFRMCNGQFSLSQLSIWITYHSKWSILIQCIRVMIVRWQLWPGTYKRKHTSWLWSTLSHKQKYRKGRRLEFCGTVHSPTKRTPNVQPPSGMTPTTHTVQQHSENVASSPVMTLPVASTRIGSARHTPIIIPYTALSTIRWKSVQ